MLLCPVAGCSREDSKHPDHCHGLRGPGPPTCPQAEGNPQGPSLMTVAKVVQWGQAAATPPAQCPLGLSLQPGRCQVLERGTSQAPGLQAAGSF